MRTEEMVGSLKHLTALHEELLAISEKKTKCIKTSDMDCLSKLLMQERKQLQAVEQAEEERQQIAESIFAENGKPETERTVSELLHCIENAEQRKRLDEAAAGLIEKLVALKQKERLNNDLIQQSMQFVQLSLDMLQPAAKNMNYTDKNIKQQTMNRSVFDSKA